MDCKFRTRGTNNTCVREPGGKDVPPHVALGQGFSGLCLNGQRTFAYRILLLCASTDGQSPSDVGMSKYRYRFYNNLSWL